MATRYKSLLRPASFATLPRGLDWKYVEIPENLARLRRDLPVSRHPHGVIECRKLSPDEIRDYSLEEV